MYANLIQFLKDEMKVMLCSITKEHQRNYTIIMNIDECVWHPWHCFASRSWPTIHMNLPHLSSYAKERLL